MNAIVMAANHGQMPVLIPGLVSGACPLDPDSDWIHSCMNAGTHLKFLADWVVIRHFGIASPGDFFLWGGDNAFWPCLVTWIGFIIRDSARKAK